MAAANGSFSSPRRPATAAVAAAAATAAPRRKRASALGSPRLTWPGAQGFGTGA